MNELKVFRNSEFGELGVVEIEGKTYFPATACARILGYSNPRDAINRHCKTEGVVKHDAWVQTGIKADGSPAMRENQTNYITEGNLYRLIVHSNLPGAERFERWVFDEVLPAIRRGGAYAPDLGAVVAQAVQATVRELLPYLAPVKNPGQRVKRKKEPGIIARLDADAREEVDEMILSNNYTYVEISAHFAEQYDIHFSRSAVGRYAQHLFDKLEQD